MGTAVECGFGMWVPAGPQMLSYGYSHGARDNMLAGIHEFGLDMVLSLWDVRAIRTQMACALSMWRNRSDLGLA